MPTLSDPKQQQQQRQRQQQAPTPDQAFVYLQNIHKEILTLCSLNAGSN